MSEQEQHINAIDQIADREHAEKMADVFLQPSRFEAYEKATRDDGPKNEFMHSLVTKSPSDLAKLEAMTEDMAKTFFSHEMQRQFSDGQIAALVLSQPRKLVEEDRAISAINRFLKFENHVNDDLLRSPQEDKNQMLGKVLAERPAGMPIWPEDMKTVGRFSAKQLAEMPAMSEAQAVSFYHQHVHELLDPQQNAAIYLSQQRLVMPAHATLEAITKLKLKSGNGEVSILHDDDYSKRHALLTEVLAAPKPRSLYEMAASKAENIFTLFGLSKSEKKNENKSSNRP